MAPQPSYWPAVRVSMLIALVVACGNSEAERTCRGARTSAARYLGVLDHVLATKTEVPAPVPRFDPPSPSADPDNAAWEAAIAEQNRLQAELADEMIANANAHEALREPARAAVKQAAATLLDDHADAMAAARTVLDHLAKLDALDATMANQAEALLHKAVAARDQLDARIKQGIKNPQIREPMSVVRKGADLQVTLLQFMTQVDDRYGLDKLALNQVSADCGTSR